MARAPASTGKFRAGGGQLLGHAAPEPTPCSPERGLVTQGQRFLGLSLVLKPGAGSAGGERSLKREGGGAPERSLPGGGGGAAAWDFEGRRGWGSGTLGLREEGAGGLDPTALVRED